jgi:hypothetical protein
MQVLQEVERHTGGDSLLDEIRRNAKHRLRQIEPLIKEADRLRGVLEVIEGRSAVAQASPSRADGVGTIVASAAPRAPKGSNKRIILELVGERPGIAPAEISQVTGIKRTVVASTVSRLKRHGELEGDDGGGVRLVAR